MKRHSNYKSRTSVRRGFSLIELLIVLAILVLLASLVAPRLLGSREKANIDAAKTQISLFKSTLEIYSLHNSGYPTTEQGLEALVSKPTTGKVPARYKRGGYLESSKIPNDPWGNPYLYESPGSHGFDYEVRSLGADGIDGGEEENADIESWNIE